MSESGVPGAPPEPPEEMGGATVRGGAWQSSARMLGQVYTILVSIVAARFLGADGMGRLVFIVYVYGTIVAVLAAGLPIAVNRYTAEALGSRSPDAMHALYRWAVRAEAVAAAIAVASLLAVAALGAQPRGAWIAAAICCGGAILQTIPNALLLGARRFQQASLIGLTTGIVGAAVKVALLVLGGGITALIAVDAVTIVANAAAAAFFARRVLRENPASPVPVPAKEFLHRARIYALTSSVGVILTIVVLQRSEVLFLNHFTTDVQIALYSIAFSSIEAMNLLPAALGLAAGSAFATLFGAGALNRIQAGFARAVRLTILVTIPMTAAAFVLGPDAIRVAYGPGYAGAGSVVRVLVLGFPGVSLLFIASALVQGFGAQRVPLIILGIAAAINLTLDLTLIPAFGAVGAAWANVLAQVAMTAPLLAYAVRRVDGIDWNRHGIVRAACTALLAGAASAVPVVRLGPGLGLILGGAVFAGAFFVVAPRLRFIGGDDADWLATSLADRFGGRAARAVRSCARPAS